MKILIVDDDVVRHEHFARSFANKGFEVHHAYRHADAISLLDSIHFDVLFLDHDLQDFIYGESGRKELTGLDVVHHVVLLPKKPKRAIVHSWNPEGARRMASCLHENGIRVFKWVFSCAMDPSELLPSVDN